MVPLNGPILQLVEPSGEGGTGDSAGEARVVAAGLEALSAQQDDTPIVWVLTPSGTVAVQLTAETAGMFCEATEDLEAGSSGDFRSDATDVVMPDVGIFVKNEPSVKPISIVAGGASNTDAAPSPSLTSPASPGASSTHTEPSGGFREGAWTRMELTDGTPRGQTLLRALSASQIDGDDVYPSTMSAEERRKARNRTAQRRFRERQRTRINDLEMEVHRLHNQLQVMEVENAKLRRENIVIKTCICATSGIGRPEPPV